VAQSLSLFDPKTEQEPDPVAAEETESAIEELLAEPTPRYACPCCGFFTLLEKPPGTYAHCEVCWWEDDPVQFRDPDYEGGANAPSLHQARANYAQIQVSDPAMKGHERKPRREELPPEQLPLNLF
jgi:hypothetical protein